MRNSFIFSAVIVFVIFSWVIYSNFRDDGIRDYCFDRRPPQYNIDVILDKCSYLISTEDKNIKKAILTRAELYFLNGYTLEAISEYELFIERFSDFEKTESIEALVAEVKSELTRRSEEVKSRVDRLINDPKNNEKVYDLIAALRTAGDRNLFRSAVQLLEGSPDSFVAIRLVRFFEILDFEGDELAVRYLRGELNVLSEKQGNYKLGLQEEMLWICSEVVSNCADH